MNKQKTKDKYDLFWDWFSDREAYIFNNLEMDTQKIAEEISNNLKLIQEDLAFEISFEKQDDVRNLVISADGIIEQFPTVIELTNRAKNYENWIITPFRPRLHQKNQVIEMENLKMDYDDIFFTYIEDDKKDIVHLDVYVRGYDGQDNRYVHTYFILLDTLVGEYDAVTKIGDTIMYPLPEQQSLEVYGFRSLLDILDSLDKSSEIN